MEVQKFSNFSCVNRKLTRQGNPTILKILNKVVTHVKRFIEKFWITRCRMPTSNASVIRVATASCLWLRGAHFLCHRGSEGANRRITAHKKKTVFLFFYLWYYMV